MGKRTFVHRLAFVGAAVVVLCAIVLLTVGQSMAWVGHTDLEVRFVVVDAKSNQPIPNAVVHFRVEPDGFCADCDTTEFKITTDANGQASHTCKNCMCFGTKGLFEDTFAVHLPSWWFHVAAEGYSETAPEYLDVPKYSHQVRRSERSATILVPMSLQSNAAYKVTSVRIAGN
jgi:hypothetical protein